MKIPEKFKLAGLTITVENDDTLVNRKRSIGASKYHEQLINVDLFGARPEVVQQTFLHELVHWILFVMGEDKMRCNERFVDLFAQFLYQFEQTKEGDICETQHTALSNNPEKNKGRQKDNAESQCLPKPPPYNE